MKTLQTLLGGLSAEEFLRDYWQKKPLLIRQAIPGFKGLLAPDRLIDLACTDDIQSRLVTQRRGKFALHHAPFTRDDFADFGTAKWTVLVQGVNHHLAAATELLKQFAFIPHARLDDLMVSYAPKGGGVGPHFDSYDVFLLQGLGHRRWQISTQTDHTLIEGAPLRILSNFQVEQEWLLEAGDMLYLPPHCAHNGIAEDDCMTYSIGFRTPAYQELAEQFLVYLQDRISVPGMYADPDLAPQPHPSEISSAMLDQVARAIRQICWDEQDIANFLGCYLSEPKPHIFFAPPARPMNPEKFRQSAQQHGVSLDLKCQILCHANRVFVNGEAHAVAANLYPQLRELADQRGLSGIAENTGEICHILYPWYVDGYLVPGKNNGGNHDCLATHPA